MNKRLAIIAGILAVALIISAAFYFSSRKSDIQQFSVQKTDLPASQLPSGFPRDLPIEANSSTLQNYEATTTDGRKQSTMVITTKKTLAQAVKVYQEYFVAQGWEEIDTPAEEGSVTAMFRKKDDALFILAKTDPTTKQNTIELTLTEAGK